MLFTRKFFEALGLPNLYKLRGSAGSGRLRQNLLPASHRADATYPHKLKSLKASTNGTYLLNDQEVQEIKQLFKITDLEENGSRNLGNTGITFYVANNQYYIKK
tara:strand:+ start:700 stop:1011 length:312 start_codon:yes stop_codon:yes gene_type:complete